MNLKKKFTVGLLVLIGAIFIAGVTAVAVTNYGTQSNPLATKSYLDSVVTQDILDSLETAVTKKADQLEKEFNNRISSVNSGDLSGTPSSFDTVTLKNGQVIRCSVGSEIMVRSGTTTCYGNGPDYLYDITDALTLTSAGAAMTNNHMYVVSAANNGLRARTDSTVVLVSGTYTVYDNL